MAVLLPALLLIAWTLVVAFALGWRRYRAVTGRTVDPRYYQLYQGEGEPDSLRAHSRHIENLYEAPTLFYALSVIAFVSGQTGTLVAGLCWAYVALRGVHSLVHLTGNDVLRRFQVFATGMVVLTALLVVVVAGIVTA